MYNVPLLSICILDVQTLEELSLSVLSRLEEVVKEKHRWREITEAHVQLLRDFAFQEWLCSQSLEHYYHTWVQKQETRICCRVFEVSSFTIWDRENFLFPKGNSCMNIYFTSSPRLTPLMSAPPTERCMWIKTRIDFIIVTEKIVMFNNPNIILELRCHFALCQNTWNQEVSTQTCFLNATARITCFL